MKKYRTKPRYMVADQYTEENKDQILQWINANLEGSGAAFINNKILRIPSRIPGLPLIEAKLGQYILWDKEGDFYPCSAEAFEDFYEEVPSD